MRTYPAGAQVESRLWGAWQGNPGSHHSFRRLESGIQRRIVCDSQVPPTPKDRRLQLLLRLGNYWGCALAGSHGEIFLAQISQSPSGGIGRRLCCYSGICEKFGNIRDGYTSLSHELVN